MRAALFKLLFKITTQKGVIALKSLNFQQKQRSKGSPGYFLCYKSLGQRLLLEVTWKVSSRGRYQSQASRDFHGPVIRQVSPTVPLP